MTMIKEQTEFAHTAVMPAGTAIKTTGSANAKTANTIIYKVAGKYYSLAPQATLSLSTASWTLSVANGKSVVVYCLVDTSWTVTFQVSDPASTLAWIVESDPVITSTKALFAKIWISNGSGFSFTVWTTALDTASVTVIYQDIYGVAV